MRRLVLLTLAAVLVPALCAAQADTAKLTLRDIYKNVFHIDTSAALSGTWTGAVNTTQLAEVAGGAAGDAQTELDAGDVIMVGGYSYRVASEPPDASTIIIVPARDPNTGALKAGLDAAATAATVYKINHGVGATLEDVLDGAGTATALSLSTTTVGAAALEVGGSYAGGSGATISADGGGQFNGDLTVDGSLTTDVFKTEIGWVTGLAALGYLQVRAPAGAAGNPPDTGGQMTIYAGDGGAASPFSGVAGGDGGDVAIKAGNGGLGDGLGAQGDGGDLTLDGGSGTVSGSVLISGGAGSSGVTVTSAGAITADGAAALNGGITVDSTAFVVTDTTGAVTSASTVTATNYLTSTVASASGAANGLSVGRNGIILDGATGGGNTLTVGWPTYSDASDGAISNAEFLVSQPGSAWYNDSTLTNGQSGFRYKASGDVNGGAVDADGSIFTSTFTDTTAHNLTGSIVSITRANVLDAGGGDAQRALEITVADGSGAVSTGAGNAIYISDARAGVENDATTEASINIATTGSFSIYATGVIQTASGLTGTDINGSRFYASLTVPDGMAASTASMGRDGFGAEGATYDADELAIRFPSYSDGGAGNQGGRYDSTATMATELEVAISIPDSGADADPAAYTLYTTAYESLYAITCLDDDECNITLSEVDLGGAAVHSGHRITIVQVTGTYDLTMADSAGVQELSAPWAPGTEGDNISLVYSTTLSAWLETGRADL